MSIGSGPARFAGAVLAVAVVALAQATASAAVGGLPAQQSCAWSVHYDPAAVNLAFPDAGAGYWALDLPAVPGETLTIEGEFPHARYISFTSYTDLLLSADGLKDVSIVPDPGSSNPFLPGALRTARRRSYTAHVVFGQRPANAAPNTLYTGSADGSRVGSHFYLLYRLYEPDRDLSSMAATGGVPLPTVVVNLPGGERVQLPDCPDVSAPPNNVNDTLANTNVAYPRSSTPAGEPGWSKFINYETSFAGSVSPQTTTSLPHGGFLDNPDNQYIYTLLTFNRGRVVAFWARLPRTPPTFDGEKRMDANVDMRYWSLCSNELPGTRVWGCLRDDQVKTYDTEGDFVVVISQPADRPSNANASCGINWLPAGPSADTLMLLRNMLPDPAFPYSVQKTQLGSEKQDMGPYYPTGRWYLNASDFASYGCAPPPQP